MPTATFYRQLGLLTLAVGGALAAIHLSVATLQPFLGFALASVALFAALTAGIYHTARAAAGHENRNRLAQYVMVLTFAKMFLGLGFVYGYYALAGASSRWFLLSFFVAYFAYTAFETVVLVRLNKAGVGQAGT